MNDAVNVGRRRTRMNGPERGNLLVRDSAADEIGRDQPACERSAVDAPPDQVEAMLGALAVTRYDERAAL